MRLGLCTGGGDCPGLNAVIRAVVTCASAQGDAEVVGIAEGLSGLMYDPPRARPLTPLMVDGIHEDGGTVLGTNNKGSPFRKAGAAKKALADAHRGWAALGLDALIVVGGDGTQFMTRRLVESGLPIVGVPKTIDNDLPGTDLTVGFATAVEVAADAAARLATSAESHRRIMVLEVMGRDAGHIALHAGLAAGAHAILIPEIPFRLDELARRIQARQAQGRDAFLLVVAEGAAAHGKDATYTTSPEGSKVMGGIGHRLAHELHHRTGLDARCTVLGHLQRGGRPNAADRLLGARLGKHAVDLVMAKRFGRIVGIRGDAVVDVPYAKISDTRRLVDLKSDWVQVAEALGITFGRKARR